MQQTIAMRLDLSPPKLLAAYAAGVFPMADDHGRIHWLAPDPRAILELDELKISRSLRTVIRRRIFEITVNRRFEDVLRSCAARREGTWISTEIVAAYLELHRMGHAHSVEAWREGQLAGGLYGVALGGAFFGESMFHRVTDASKVALVHLVERLKVRGFTLLDVQFQTPHLAGLGAREIPRAVYERRLRAAILRDASFIDEPPLNPLQPRTRQT